MEKRSGLIDSNQICGIISYSSTVIMDRSIVSTLTFQYQCSIFSLQFLMGCVIHTLSIFILDLAIFVYRPIVLTCSVSIVVYSVINLQVLIGHAIRNYKYNLDHWLRRFTYYPCSVYKSSLLIQALPCWKFDLNFDDVCLYLVTG